MKRNTLFNLLLAFGVLLILSSGITMAPGALAQGPEPQGDVGAQAAVGTAFTYQGYLTDASGPVNGTCNFTFTLHDALSDGSQLGSVPKNNVEVKDGYFGVDMDFGAGKFTGDARYLGIAVDCGGGSTTLSPRVVLNPVPYALHSLDTASYQNVIVVAKSGGDYTSIQAALDSITDASDTNRYLVWVAPGTYGETVTMKPYVDIEGAGELVTKITVADPSTIGTVVGANNTELRFLTVESTGGGGDKVAIHNDGASPRLTHVTAIASGTGTTYGVYNENNSSPTMTHVTATASDGSYNHGVGNYNDSSPVMTHVTATASGGNLSLGVYNYNSSPTMTNMTASASGASANYGVENDNASAKMTHMTAEAWGGSNNYGVYNHASSVMMTDVTAIAERDNSYGVYNHDSSATIQNSTISASRGTNNYGIYNDACAGTCNVKVNNSQITGSTNTIRNSAGFNTYVGASQLDGGAVNVAVGTVTCYSCYDEVYTNAGGVNVCP